MESGVSTRQAILEGAGRVFAQFGLRKTTMGEIIRASGYSRGTVYKHFSTKEEVFNAVLRRELEDILLRVQRAMSEEGATREKLKAALCTQFESVREKMNVYRVTLQNWAELAADAGFMQAHTRGEGPLERFIRDLIGGLLEEGVKRGEIVVDDIELTTTAIQAAFKGAAMIVLFSGNADDYRPLVERLLDMLFDGLVPREEKA